MQQEPILKFIPPTLAVLVKSLGERTNVVDEALRRLKEQGHEYSRSTIYTTIQKNGRNNPTIAAALLDVIEAEKATRQRIADRQQALAE